MKLIKYAAAAFLAAGMTLKASAASYGFDKLTGNNSADISSQLSVDITGTSTHATFTIKNAAGGVASSITEIYFDDGLFAAAPTIANGSDVSYETGANPHLLPGRNLASPVFVTDVIFNSQADGNNTTGINVGEQVALTFGLGSFANLNAVFAAMESGSLRIGLHVRAIGGGTSDSYLSRGNNVPDGGSTLALVGLAIAGLGLARRKLS